MCKRIFEGPFTLIPISDIKKSDTRTPAIVEEIERTGHRRNQVMRQPLIPDSIVNEILVDINKVSAATQGMQYRVVHIGDHSQRPVTRFVVRSARSIHMRARL